LKCRRDAFGDAPIPASTLLNVPQLAWPYMMIEIDVTAALPNKWVYRSKAAISALLRPLLACVDGFADSGSYKTASPKSRRFRRRSTSGL